MHGVPALWLPAAGMLDRARAMPHRALGPPWRRRAKVTGPLKQGVVSGGGVAWRWSARSARVIRGKAFIYLAVRCFVIGRENRYMLDSRCKVGALGGGGASIGRTSCQRRTKTARHGPVSWPLQTSKLSTAALTAGRPPCDLPSVPTHMALPWRNRKTLVKRLSPRGQYSDAAGSFHCHAVTIIINTMYANNAIMAHKWLRR